MPSIPPVNDPIEVKKRTGSVNIQRIEEIGKSFQEIMTLNRENITEAIAKKNAEEHWIFRALNWSFCQKGKNYDNFRVNDKIEIKDKTYVFKKVKDTLPVLGKGARGITYLVERECDKEQFALKIQKMDETDSAAVHPFNEFKLQKLAAMSELGRVMDPLSLTTLRGTNCTCLLMPLGYKDLFDYMTEDKTFQPKKWTPTSKRFAIQILETLNQLRNTGVSHFDLKPENFLVCIDKQGTAHLKLTDFGTAKHEDIDDILKDRFVGTPFFLPTVNPSRDPCLDTYAAAIMIMELFDRKGIYECQTGVGIREQYKLKLKYIQYLEQNSTKMGSIGPSLLEIVQAKGNVEKSVIDLLEQEMRSLEANGWEF